MPMPALGRYRRTKPRQSVRVLRRHWTARDGVRLGDRSDGFLRAVLEP
ncbi:hypothetical protein [Streptomyces sp. S4.7]|nr:hypothetical protein [Streptomyces sp. S4.7]